MMKQLLVILSTAFIFSCSSTKVAKEHKQQLNYIPNTFHNTYLGMPLSEFIKVRKNAVLATEEGFRTTYLEAFEEGDIKSVAYYFGTKGNLPLYEYVIDYHSKEMRDAFVKANLGEPNDGEEWRFDSKEGFKIKAWTFNNKLVVTGLIIDTEWYDDEKSD
jgi:hypothetical protein